MAPAYQAVLGVGLALYFDSTWVGDIFPTFAITSSKRSLDSHSMGMYEEPLGWAPFGGKQDEERGHGEVQQGRNACQEPEQRADRKGLPRRCETSQGWR